jgi:hypothetical protein
LRILEVQLSSVRALFAGVGRRRSELLCSDFSPT